MQELDKHSTTEWKRLCCESQSRSETRRMSRDHPNWWMLCEVVGFFVMVAAVVLVMTHVANGLVALR